jgi:hypothetical protein
LLANGAWGVVNVAVFLPFILASRRVKDTPIEDQPNSDRLSKSNTHHLQPQQVVERQI